MLPALGRGDHAGDQSAIKSLLVELDEGGRAKWCEIADPAAWLQKFITAFQRKELEGQRPAHVVAFREGALDDRQETELMEKIMEQERRRQGISEPRDG